MNLDNKKQLERQYARALLQSLGRSDKIDLTHFGVPDVLVPGRSILGIEVTQIYRSDKVSKVPLRAVEGGWQLVLDNLAKSWESSNLPGVEVKIRFSPDFHVRKVDAREMSEKIFNLLIKLMPDSGDDYYMPDDFYPLPPGITHINISRVIDYLPSCWSYYSSSFPPLLTQAVIKERIAEKESLLEKYREHCAEIWLLIVLHRISRSTDFELDETILRDPYPSGFDLLYLLDATTSRVSSLQN